MEATLADLLQIIGEQTVRIRLLEQELAATQQDNEPVEE